MPDRLATEAERLMQTKFSIGTLAGGLLLLAAIAVFDGWLFSVPNRSELGWRDARIEFSPVAFDGRAFAPLRLAGAWTVTSDDPRLGGISGLAVDRGQLVALSDYGVVVRFSPPGPQEQTARIGELSDGPGSGRYKRNRDSEALARDPAGRGWWVAFENRHELWLYDRDFGQALQRIRLGDRGWRANRGVEAAAPDGIHLLLFHESGRQLLRVTGSSARELVIGDSRGRISDATAAGAGQVIAIERRPTPIGFKNALVAVERGGAGYRFGRRISLSLGPIDNVEAIAVERLPDGTRRLWLMTDDNFQPPLRTLLVAVDIPASGGAPPR
jgi:hypothetical protein